MSRNYTTSLKSSWVQKMFGPSSLSYPPKTPLQTEKHASNNFHNFHVNFRQRPAHLVLSRKRSIKLTLRSLSLDPWTWQSKSRYDLCFFRNIADPKWEFSGWIQCCHEGNWFSFTFDCFCLFCLVFCWCFCFFWGVTSTKKKWICTRRV